MSCEARFLIQYKTLIWRSIIKKFFSYYFIIILFLILFIYFFQDYNNLKNSNSCLNSNTYHNFFNNEFIWPLPGIYTITSYFGPRHSPTTGASSYHSGIDIAASENTNIYSVLSGIVTFIGFQGAGGYTITITSDNFSISYCHISPNFIVSKNDYVEKNTLIGYVGPKNIYTEPNNPYKDSFGKPTNGATTGCHLHLTIKKDGKAVNPLNFF